MGISRSAYYYKPKEGKEKEDKRLTALITDIALEHPYYGYRRVTKTLQSSDENINHKRVLRLMREANLCSRKKKSYKHLTNSAHNLKKYPNLIKDILPTGPNQVWHADITYIRLESSFVYLAAIIDGFSRKVVGYGISRSLHTDLPLAALADAIKNRETGGLIHHSDQGVQYCSDDYVNMLKENGISISMSDKGNPYDNAKAESFFRTLKVEEVYMFEYRTYQDVIDRITYFIEEVYNRKRLHSSLDYLSPEDFENKLKIVNNTGYESHQLAKI